MKPANSVVMWAVICRGSRAEWINYQTIRRTRRDAWAVYCSWYDDKKTAVAQRRKKHIRLARVVVTLKGGAK